MKHKTEINSKTHLYSKINNNYIIKNFVKSNLISGIVCAF